MSKVEILFSTIFFGHLRYSDHLPFLPLFVVHVHYYWEFGHFKLLFLKKFANFNHFWFLASVGNGKIMYEIQDLQPSGYITKIWSEKCNNYCRFKKYLAEKTNSVNTFYLAQSKYNRIHNLKIIAQWWITSSLLYDIYKKIYQCVYP